MNSELKQELTTALINFLKPIQKNILYYEKHYNKIEKITKKRSTESSENSEY